MSGELENKRYKKKTDSPICDQSVQGSHVPWQIAWELGILWSISGSVCVTMLTMWNATLWQASAIYSIADQCCVLTSSKKARNTLLVKTFLASYTASAVVFFLLFEVCCAIIKAAPLPYSSLKLPCTLLTSQCNAETRAMCLLLTNDWGIHCWLQSILGSLRTRPCTAPQLVFSSASEDKLKHFNLHPKIRIPLLDISWKNVPELNESSIKKTTFDGVFCWTNPLSVVLRLLPEKECGREDAPDKKN